MNFVNLRAVGAPYGACSPSEDEDDAAPELTFAARSRAWKRQYLHEIYREILADYHEPTSEWMRQFARRTLQNIWENYRDARESHA